MLRAGDRVSYEAGVDDRNGKQCAINISGGNGSIGYDNQRTMRSGAILQAAKRAAPTNW